MRELDSYVKGFLILAVCLIAWFVLLIFFVFNQDRGNQCTKEGNQAVYNQFGVFEKCIKEGS